MNKKIAKILTIIIYILFITCIVSNVYATISGSFDGTLTDLEEDGEEGLGPVKTILKAILTVVRNVGVFIAVGILMIVACKYIIASAGDRADIKKHAISYVIGAIILFATSGIAGILKAIIDDAFGTSGP